MRLVVYILGLSLLAAPAQAQDTLDERQNCYPVALSGLVEVTTDAGPVREATLLCMGNEKVVLAAEGRVETIPLSEVTRIEKPADGVGDGFLKGAAVAAIVSLLCWQCQDAGERAMGIVVYGGIGAAIDALHGGRETLYRRNENQHAPRATIAWRVRF